MGTCRTILTLCGLCVVFFRNGADASCTFPAALRGAWVSSSMGDLMFNETHIWTWPVHTFGSLVFVCDVSEGTQYVSRSEVFYWYNLPFEAFLCLDLRNITDYSFYYYQPTKILAEAANTRMKMVLENKSLNVSEACDVTDFSTITYSVMVKKDSVSLAKLECPPLFLGAFNYTFDDGYGSQCSSDSYLDVCSDKYIMTFDYSLCSAQQAYSASGELYCVNEISTGNTTQLHVYNADATTDESTTYRFTCYVIEAVGNDIYATQYPQDCQLSQTATTVTSPGATLVMSPYYTCEYDTTTAPATTTTTLTTTTTAATTTTTAATTTTMPTTTEMTTTPAPTASAMVASADTGMIMGVVLGILVLAAAVLIVIFFLKFKKFKKTPPPKLIEEETLEELPEEVLSPRERLGLPDSSSYDIEKMTHVENIGPANQGGSQAVTEAEVDVGTQAEAHNMQGSDILDLSWFKKYYYKRLDKLESKMYKEVKDDYLVEDRNPISTPERESSAVEWDKLNRIKQIAQNRINPLRHIEDVDEHRKLKLLLEGRMYMNRRSRNEHKDEFEVAIPGNETVAKRIQETAKGRVRGRLQRVNAATSVPETQTKKKGLQKRSFRNNVINDYAVGPGCAISAHGHHKRVKDGADKKPEEEEPKPKPIEYEVIPVRQGTFDIQSIHEDPDTKSEDIDIESVRGGWSNSSRSASGIQPSKSPRRLPKVGWQSGKEREEFFAFPVVPDASEDKWKGFHPLVRIHRKQYPKTFAAAFGDSTGDSADLQTLKNKLPDLRWRELLEELYKDKKYLDYVQASKKPGEDNISENATDGLDYLYGRAKFWEEKEPIPARPIQYSAPSSKSPRKRSPLSPRKSATSSNTFSLRFSNSSLSSISTVKETKRNTWFQ